MFHYKNKDMYKFYAFTFKTDFRSMSESREFKRKNKVKHSKGAHFATFFSKSVAFIEKINDKRLSIFNCKNKCTYKFYVFTIKSAFENMSVGSEFKSEY